MITDLLLPALRERFPDRGMQRGTLSNEVAVFPAAHPEVGNLTIWDDGDEATVGIGEITHGHFNPNDDSLSSAEVARRVTDDVLEFLQDLFSDRVLLWKSRNAGSGGWRILGHGTDNSLMEGDDLRYLWSGPIKNPDLNRAG